MTRANKLQVFLADDHAVVRAGIRALVEAEADMEIVGESADGRDALERLTDCRPDVAVMDLSMPGMNGIQVTAELKRTCPNVRVVVLSVHEDRGYPQQALVAGAVGYMLKRSAGAELIQALRVVALGGLYFCHDVGQTLLGERLNSAPLRGEAAGDALSEREGEVIRLVAQGHTNREVAGALGLSVKTAETYKARAMEKLGFAGRTELVRHAARVGWLETD